MERGPTAHGDQGFTQYPILTGLVLLHVMAAPPIKTLSLKSTRLKAYKINQPNFMRIAQALSFPMMQTAIKSLEDINGQQ